MPEIVRAFTGGGGSEPAIAPGTTSQYWRGDKTWQTLNAAAVTDSTPTGRSLLTATDAAAARGVLGSGTQNAGSFLRGDGTWSNSLSAASTSGVGSYHFKVTTPTNSDTDRAVLNFLGRAEFGYDNGKIVVGDQGANKVLEVRLGTVGDTTDTVLTMTRAYGFVLAPGIGFVSQGALVAQTTLDAVPMQVKARTTANGGQTQHLADFYDKDANVWSWLDSLGAYNSLLTANLQGVNVGVGLGNRGMVYLNPAAAADATTTTQDSGALQFNTNYWNGSASTSESANITLRRRSATAGDAYFEVGEDVSVLGTLTTSGRILVNAGDVRVPSSNLYLGDQTQTIQSMLTIDKKASSGTNWYNSRQYLSDDTTYASHVIVLRENGTEVNRVSIRPNSTDFNDSVNVTGTVAATAGYTVSGNQAMMKSTYGTGAVGWLWKDSTGLYVLLGAPGDMAATTFDSRRPFTVNLSTGRVSMNEGVTVTGTDLTINTAAKFKLGSATARGTQATQRRNNATQATTASAWTKIIPGASQQAWEDDGGAYTSGDWTAKTSGFYVMTCAMSWSPAGTGSHRALRIASNTNSAAVYAQTYAPATMPFRSMEVTYMGYMAAGETISAYFYHDSGTAITLNADSSTGDPATISFTRVA